MAGLETVLRCIRVTIFHVPLLLALGLLPLPEPMRTGMPTPKRNRIPDRVFVVASLSVGCFVVN